MARGGYTPSDIREMDNDEVLFLYHYQNRAEDRRFEKLGSYLGVLWDLEEVANPSQSSADQSTKLFFPLSTVIKPELMDFVKKKANSITTTVHNSIIGGGDYVKGANEKIIPMSTLSKEDFLKMIGKPNAAQMRQQQKDQKGRDNDRHGRES